MSRVCISCLFSQTVDKSSSPSPPSLLHFQVWGVCSDLNILTKESRTLWFLNVWQPQISSRSVLRVMTAFCDWKRQRTEFPVDRVSHCPELSSWSTSGSLVLREAPHETKLKLGRPCFRNPLVCVCETQATSTIHALQTATSFRHTFKGKVSSSHYTACSHYAVLYIDPSFICRMWTGLYISTARCLERLQIF